MQQAIKFTAVCEFAYLGRSTVHYPGDVVGVHVGDAEAKFDESGVVKSIRKDKAQRWLKRCVAAEVVATKAEETSVAPAPPVAPPPPPAPSRPALPPPAPRVQPKPSGKKHAPLRKSQ